MDHRLGVLAFGDSITNGGGELQWGVALQSWALWTARGLGLPYSGFAADGATAAHVVRSQIPALRGAQRRPRRALRRRLPVRRRQRRTPPDWDPVAYGRDLRTALAFLRERCDRVLVCALPLDLGRPRAGARVEVANERIEQGAAEVGALVVDLRGFGARGHWWRGRSLPDDDKKRPGVAGLDRQPALREATLDTQLHAA